MRHDKIGRQQWTTQLAALEMNIGDDPQDLFDAIQAIFILANQADPDNLMIEQEIRDQYELKLPKIYLDCISQFNNHIPVATPGANAGDPPTIASFVYTDITNQEIKDAVIDNKYQQLTKQQAVETSLANFNPFQRKGRQASVKKHCYYCHKDGHTKAECRKKKNNCTNKRCTHYGSNTHTVNWCFQLHPHPRMQAGNQHANGRRGNRPNNHNFNNRRGKDQ